MLGREIVVKNLENWLEEREPLTGEGNILSARGGFPSLHRGAHTRQAKSLILAALTYIRPQAVFVSCFTESPLSANIF